jgi:hypothetical protein
MFLQGTHSLRKVYLAFPRLILPQKQVCFGFLQCNRSLRRLTLHLLVSSFHKSRFISGIFLQGIRTLRKAYLAFPGLILQQEKVNFRDVPAGYTLIEEPLPCISWSHPSTRAG